MGWRDVHRGKKREGSEVEKGPIRRRKCESGTRKHSRGERMRWGGKRKQVRRGQSLDLISIQFDVSSLCFLARMQTQDEHMLKEWRNIQACCSTGNIRARRKDMLQVFFKYFAQIKMRITEVNTLHLNQIAAQKNTYCMRDLLLKFSQEEVWNFSLWASQFWGSVVGAVSYLHSSKTHTHTALISLLSYTCSCLLEQH